MVIGQRLSRLVVLAFAGYNNSKRKTYLCRCDCGNEVIKDILVLRSSKTPSCGCAKAEVLRSINTTHGSSRYVKGVGRDPTYQTWVGMRFRCRDKTDPDYCGRGISVCQRWDSYSNFLADMGPRPPGLEIDRIDNDGNYEPNNCHWVTHAFNCQKSRRQKLDKGKAEAIRSRRRETAESLAREYGVSEVLVFKIWQERIWK